MSMGTGDGRELEILPTVTEASPGLGAVEGIEAAAAVSDRGQSPLRRSLRRLRRDPVALGAVAFLLFVVVVALVGLVWTPKPPNAQDVSLPFANPSLSHPLGTDDLGRDVASRLMVGAGYSLRICLQVVFQALLIAIPIGLVAGYRGGWVDNLIMRVLDAVNSIPGLVLAIAIVGVLPPGIGTEIIALTLLIFSGFARLIRAQALAVTATDYIDASRSVGTRTPRMLVTRVLPGVVPALLVQVSLALGWVLIADASLTFLGLGVPPPAATWGGSLQRAYTSIFIAPWAVVAPALTIALTVLGFSLLGDAVRDALGSGTSGGRRRRARLGLTSVRRDPGVTVPTIAADRTPLLAVRDLRVRFDTSEQGSLTVIDGVSFDLRPGEILGLVGESGSGKTATALSILRLLPSPPGVIAGGAIWFEGQDLLTLPLSGMRAVRGAGISMVFQNPMSSLDPTTTIGRSLTEAIRAHQKVSRRAARARAIELLDLVGIPAAASRLDHHPHEFSGGMNQRVMIAMALAGEPKLLIADEPTTALDVSVQAQILELLASLRERLNMAVLLITHDLGVVADLCDRVLVMYGGRIVEQARIHDLYVSPRHPYTSGLLASVPTLAGAAERLVPIPGVPPSLRAMPTGCVFHPRCAHARPECTTGAIPLRALGEDREVRCIREAEIVLQGIR